MNRKTSFWCICLLLAALLSFSAFADVEEKKEQGIDAAALSSYLSKDYSEASVVLTEDIAVTVNDGEAPFAFAVSGKKTLDLNGHSLLVSDPSDDAKALFTLCAGASLTVSDSVGGSVIRFDRGEDPSPLLYRPNEEKTASRDIFRLCSGSSLMITGGTFEAGREERRWKAGVRLEGIDTPFAGTISTVTGGSVVRALDGSSLTVSGGTFFGYGYECLSYAPDSENGAYPTDISVKRSAAVILEDGAECVVYDGVFVGHADADAFSVSDNAVLHFHLGECSVSGTSRILAGCYEENGTLSPFGFPSSAGRIGIPHRALAPEKTSIVQDGAKAYDPEKSGQTAVLPIPCTPKLLTDGEALDSVVVKTDTDRTLTVDGTLLHVGSGLSDPDVSYCRAEYLWYLSGKNKNAVLLMKTDSSSVSLADLCRIGSVGKNDRVGIFCVIEEHFDSNHSFTLTSVSETLSLGFCEHEWQLCSAIPSCTGNGTAYYRCLLCGEGRTGTSADPEGHYFVPDPEGGCGGTVCVSCGEKRGGGHKWEIIKTETTCTEKIVTSKCSACGLEKIAATKRAGSHKFGAYTDIDGTYHLRVCSACGYRELSLHKTAQDGQKCTQCSLLTSGSFPTVYPIVMKGAAITGAVLSPDASECSDWLTKTASLNGTSYEWFVSDMPDGTDAVSVGKEASLALSEDFAGKYVILTAKGNFKGSAVTAVSQTVPVSSRQSLPYQSDEFSHYRVLPEGGARFDSAAHVPGDWIVVKNASCTESGLRRLECTVCGCTLSEEVIPSGHDFGAWSGEEPTCEKNGYIRHVCTKCGAAEGILLSPTGHFRLLCCEIPADCMVKGESSHYTCAYCGTSFSHETPSLKITYYELPRDFEAHVSGLQEYNAREHYYLCKCGEQTSKEAHIYDESGEICVVCGYVKGSLPETNDPFWEETEPEDDETDTPETGRNTDTESRFAPPLEPENHLTQWLVLACAAGGILLVSVIVYAVLALKKRKK